MIERVAGSAVVHWNPRRNSLPFPFNRLPVGKRVNNFGDLLGPLIVERQLEVTLGLQAQARGASRLLSVGSIMGLAQDGDVIWGTGVNGKVGESSHVFTNLDVRAVRGPKTAEFLAKRGIEVPEVYGDPALLVPQLFPEWRTDGLEKTRRIGVLPNFHDFSHFRDHPGVISPIGAPDVILREILRSETVIASSLHGIILAEAYGVPVVPLVSGTEPPFKYEDYFEGTGRSDVPLLSDLSSATRFSGGGSWGNLSETWSSRPLELAFPIDLWSIS